MGARGLAIRDDLSPEGLRRRARREADRVAASRTPGASDLITRAQNHRT